MPQLDLGQAVASTERLMMQQLPNENSEFHTPKYESFLL